MIRRCDGCQFSTFAIITEGPVRECRRNPPVTVPPWDPPDTDIVGDLDGEVIVTVDMHRWPVVRDDDWCGEYLPEE